MNEQRGHAAVAMVLIGAALMLLAIGIVCGARIGAYIHLKLDERGQIAPRNSQQCKAQGDLQ